MFSFKKRRGGHMLTT